MEVMGPRLQHLVRLVLLAVVGFSGGAANGETAAQRMPAAPAEAIELAELMEARRRAAGLAEDLLISAMGDIEVLARRPGATPVNLREFSLRLVRAGAMVDGRLAARLALRAADLPENAEPHPRAWPPHLEIRRLVQLAEHCAPADPAARDKLLRRAVAEADRLLADPDVWRPGADEPRPLGQSLAAEGRHHRQWLELHRALWMLILERADAEEFQRLFARGREAGSYAPGDFVRQHDEVLLHSLMRLEAPLAVALARDVVDARVWERIAQFEVRSQWHLRAPDRFLQALARDQLDRGNLRLETVFVLGVLDAEDAMARAQALRGRDERETARMRATAVEVVITAQAWTDYESAFAAAEKMRDGSARYRVTNRLKRLREEWESLVSAEAASDYVPPAEVPAADSAADEVLRAARYGTLHDFERRWLHAEAQGVVTFGTKFTSAVALAERVMPRMK